MEHAALAESTSDVAEYLRAFYRQTPTTHPRTGYPYTCSSSSSFSSSPTSSKSAKYIHPHSYLSPNRSWSELVEDIVLKDWSGAHRRIILKTPPSSRRLRPATMRMKDSDDYITARAANPRTGMVSPSVGTASPRPPCTPDDPGEALRLVINEDPPSPTPDMGARPPLRRANERRRPSDERRQKWRAEADGWITETGSLTASPRLAHIKVDALPATCGGHALGDDQFVVRMPSAHEPQPYEYPGYSSRQIEAFEHYKRKARPVSDEGYGASMVPASIQSAGMSQGAVHEDCSTLRVMKRGDATKDGGHVSRNRNSFDAASFAPFSSPRTPMATQAHDVETTLRTLPHGGIKHLHRKPVRTAIECQSSANRHAQCSDGDQRGTALRQQPLSTIVHPSRPGIPQPHITNGRHEAPRTCSLGCHKSSDGTVCLERRTLSNSASALFGRAHHPADTVDAIPGAQINGSVLPQSKSSAKFHQQPLTDTLITATVNLITACTYLRLPALPRPAVFDVLYCERTTTQEKVQALKTVLSTMGQVVLLLTVMAMLWQIGSAVVRVLEVFCWPLMVPMKILRWLANGG